MLLPPRLSSKQLAELSYRIGIELAAGIDIRRIWIREAGSAPFRTRAQFASVRDAVDTGESLSVGLARTGHLFPPMFLEMVHVGEQTGTLVEVFQRLARHYRHQVEMRRTFLSLIWWPVVQLGISICVIGIMIWIMGIIQGRNQGEPIDILGFGLIGSQGLIIYINFIISVGLCLAGLVAAVRRGMLWTRPLQRRALQIPGLGPALEKICLARLTWAMHLTLNVEMDLRRLIPLVLQIAGNDRYVQQADTIVAAIVAGKPMHEAFCSTGIFPRRFLDVLEVGEESGQIVETMERLSAQYQEEAESAMKTISVMLGTGIWILVAALIIMLVFRIFGFYIGAINDALKM
jgi:type IV pilus assembly protein PilC